MGRVVSMRWISATSFFDSERRILVSLVLKINVLCAGSRDTVLYISFFRETSQRENAEGDFEGGGVCVSFDAVQRFFRRLKRDAFCIWIGARLVYMHAVLWGIITELDAQGTVHLKKHVLAP